MRWDTPPLVFLSDSPHCNEKSFCSVTGHQREKTSFHNLDNSSHPTVLSHPHPFLHCCVITLTFTHRNTSLVVLLMTGHLNWTGLFHISYITPNHTKMCQLNKQRLKKNRCVTFSINHYSPDNTFMCLNPLQCFIHFSLEHKNKSKLMS